MMAGAILEEGDASVADAIVTALHPAISELGRAQSDGIESG